MAAFDEMGFASGETRQLYRQVARWLEETPPELLASRRVQAEYMFRRMGVTFGVYGDKDAAERLIPFDIIPRLNLAGGMAQARRRARALNLFLKDVYGKRAVLKESIISPELIVRNPFYRPEMIGQRAPHDIWVNIAGIDIVRTTLAPRRVDVIYRRVEDDFLDPLVFNPVYVLGVPGLVGQPIHWLAICA
jgi:uncharacterized circularly permuted ATP-grasp superfamily protein